MMKSKNVHIKLPRNKVSNLLNEADSCEVSKASAEIMLERFCNGKEIDFPFSQ